MRLAIVGTGKMGRLVAQLAPDHGFEVALQLSGHDNRQGQGITAEAFSGIDAAIEFSTPEAAPRIFAALRNCVSPQPPVPPDGRSTLNTSGS